MDKNLGVPPNERQPRLPERYEIRRHVADGGMAAVWCAFDRVLGRQVAVKVLDSRFAHDEGAVRRFKREARTAARLSTHPHVITIFDVGDSGESPYIVMEYLAGGTVADALRVGAVAREDALRWLRETAGALDYAHGRGVVHRDIKPGNLLLSRERTVYVADFGIAQLGTEETLTGTGQLLGTSAYLSPEQALGCPATEASDRYALAVAAFELLTGQRPFTAANFTEQARQHIDQQPPRASRRNPGLPRAVDSVLARGMAKRPGDRWATATDFAVALDAALSPVQRARPFRFAAALAGSGRGRLDPIRSRGRGRPESNTSFGGPDPGSRVAAPTEIAPAAPPIFAAASAPARRPAGLFALGGLAAAALAIGAVAGANHSGSPAHARASVPANRTNRPLIAARPQISRPVEPRPEPPPPTTTTSVADAAPTADELEARGHQLMLDGDYGAAIQVLRQAVDAAPPEALTYAYALYDLGRSLRLAGDPQAAIPILERRLQIPNQTSVVLTELQLARQAADQSSGGAASNSGPGDAPSNSGSGGAPSNSGSGGAPSNSGSGGAPSNSGPGGTQTTTNAGAGAPSQPPDGGAGLAPGPGQGGPRKGNDHGEPPGPRPGHHGFRGEAAWIGV